MDRRVRLRATIAKSIREIESTLAGLREQVEQDDAESYSAKVAGIASSVSYLAGLIGALDENEMG